MKKVSVYLKVSYGDHAFALNGVYHGFRELMEAIRDFLSYHFDFVE